MNRCRDDQSDMTVDAASIIPPALGVSGIHAHGEGIVSGLDQRGDIKAEGHIPAVVHAKFLTIEPIAAGAVNPIKFQPDTTAWRISRQHQVFPIPRDLTRVAIGTTRAHRALDHIIVRNRDDAPCAIVKSGACPGGSRQRRLVQIHQLDGRIKVGAVLSLHQQGNDIDPCRVPDAADIHSEHLRPPTAVLLEPRAVDIDLGITTRHSNKFQRRPASGEAFDLGPEPSMKDGALGPEIAALAPLFPGGVLASGNI